MWNKWEGHLNFYTCIKLHIINISVARIVHCSEPNRYDKGGETETIKTSVVTWVID